MNYFTSDTHFYDNSQLIDRHRPFKSVADMNSYILGEMKKSLTSDDVLWHLGDFSFCRDAVSHSWVRGLTLVEDIPAKVNLIMGNNEDRIVKYFFNGDYDEFVNYCKELGFANVYPNHFIKTEVGEYYLSHEPTKEDKGVQKLHGHIHRCYGIVGCGCGINLSTDLHYFKPISEDKLIQIIADCELDKEYVDGLHK